MKSIVPTVKSVIKAGVLQVPFFKKFYDAYDSCPWQPGHFYSTIPSLTEIERRKARIFENSVIKGIDLKEEEQLKLLEVLKPFYNTMPFTFDDSADSRLRYRSKDAYYRYSDAVFLHCVLRHFEPSAIIEVGSGHSSAIMLDTNELFFQNRMHISFIDPYPEERLNSILKAGDQACSRVYKEFVQNIDIELFRSLRENDILFIDSTHVSKVGSDVNFLFFEILPDLRPGVLIHIHDIFFPFELPERWIFEQKFFWNEIYLLRAFLMNNNDFEIIMFNSFMQKRHTKWFQENMPVCLKGSEFTGSIWLRKIR